MLAKQATLLLAIAPVPCTLHALHCHVANSISFSDSFSIVIVELKVSDIRDHSHSLSKKMRPANVKACDVKDNHSQSDLWTDGLICAFEYVRGQRKSVQSSSPSKTPDKLQMDVECPKMYVPTNGSRGASLRPDRLLESSSAFHLSGSQLHASGEKYGQFFQSGQFNAAAKYEHGHWVPIGWTRILEIVQTVQVDGVWASQQFEFADDEDDFTGADLAASYWERPSGPIWWCNVSAGHPDIEAWLRNAQWLHPAVRAALRDESRLISERMKHLRYEVPVRVAGGLLFELLGQSVGDPFVDEDDVPVVLRSWHAQKFLVTVMHVKGSVSRVNVLGITEVQELLSAGGYNTPRTVHEVIAHLACHLSRWDDRFFRKSIFGAADEIELKFMNRRNHEDINLLSVILNQEIRWLSRQVIRVKWSLHAREEIVFELLQHVRGNVARNVLEGIRKSTRDMIEEQEAVRGRLFTIQDVMLSTVRAWLQDRSLRVTHNLGVFGGVGVVLTIITGLFGINVDGIPGAAKTPYAFGVFTAIIFFIGAGLIALGLVYLGLRKPIEEEQVEVRKLELQELVRMFQHEAETHAQVHKSVHRNNLPPTAGDTFNEDCGYLLLQ